MFSSLISKRFGKRFCSSIPKQSSCSTCTKKIGLGLGLLGSVCAFVFVAKRDRDIAEQLKERPYFLDQIWFPSEQDCMTAMEYSGTEKSLINAVPWYHRRAILTQYPKCLPEFEYDQYGIFDVEKKVIQANFANAQFCHDEHLEELAKLIPNQLVDAIRHNPKLIHYYHIPSSEKLGFLKKVIEEDHRRIVRCPEEYTDGLLASLPKHLFDEPNNFIDLVLPGPTFEKYFGQFKYYKVTDGPELHRGLRFQYGLVADHQPFDKKEQCSYGIHFSRFPEQHLGLYSCGYGNGVCNLREVDVSVASNVRIGHNTVKADRVFLSHPLTRNYTKDFPYEKSNDKQSKIRKPPTF
jgi:hypothetical protein